MLVLQLATCELGSSSICLFGLQEQLQRMMGEKLTENTYEIVSKSL
jgi:hypothetical protein